MNITKQNGNLTINEYGLKLDLNAASLFKTYLNPISLSFLENAIEIKLVNLLREFEDMDFNFINNHPNIKVNQIYEYACLIRDFGEICGDVFETFYEDNQGLHINIIP
jgi:hypothetical protein